MIRITSKLGAWLLLAASLPAVTCGASNSDAPDPISAEKARNLIGIYEAVPVGQKIPLEIAAFPASLDVLPLTPTAKASAKPAIDPKNLCQVLGPFRMMARPDVKFEILGDAPNKFVMLFERSSWGHVRTINLDAEHIKDFTGVRPMWNGDSTATWDKDVLVIDSLHFTNKTWLNEAGVLNSKQLHLTERLRLLDDGKYLEYKSTAVDPDVLTEPVTYTRYFRRTSSEIQEYNCFDHMPRGHE